MLSGLRLFIPLKLAHVSYNARAGRTLALGLAQHRLQPGGTGLLAAGVDDAPLAVAQDPFLVFCPGWPGARTPLQQTSQGFYQIVTGPFPTPDAPDNRRIVSSKALLICAAVILA